MQNPRDSKRLTRSVVKKLLLAGCSTLVALLLAEAIYRLFSGEKVELHGMYSEEEAAGVGLTPGFEGSMRTSEFEYKVSINELGMRDYSVGTKDPVTRRVLVIGDSFVFGVGVELENSLPKALERQLNALPGYPQVQVFNAGVPGYSPFQELHTLRRIAPVLEPDLVVLVFFVGDDWFGNAPRRPPEEVRRGFKGWLQVHSALFRSFDRLVLARLKARQQYDIHRRAPPGDFVVRMQHVLELLEAIRSAAKEVGAALLVVLNPRFTQIYDDAWGKAARFYRLSEEEYDPFEPNASFVELLRERHFRVVDLLGPLREEGAQRMLNFPLDGHWNPEGNEFVASVLVKTIRPWLEDSAAGTPVGEGASQ